MNYITWNKRRKPKRAPLSSKGQRSSSSTSLPTAGEAEVPLILLLFLYSIKICNIFTLGDYSRASTSLFSVFRNGAPELEASGPSTSLLFKNIALVLVWLLRVPIWTKQSRAIPPKISFQWARRSSKSSPTSPWRRSRPSSSPLCLCKDRRGNRRA